MFLKYFEFIFAPFRSVNNKIMGVQNIKGNIQVDINRAKSMKARGAQFAGEANGKINGFAGQQVVGNQQAIGAGAAMQQQGGMPGGQPGMPGGQPQQGGMPGGQPQQGAPGMPPGMPGMPPQQQGPAIKEKGFWIFKKKFCSQCEQQLYKTWDACPYCAQIAQQIVAAPAKMEKAKTQAFMMDGQGGPSTMQLLGWIIPLQGAQRGELFTLQPVTKIGTDPKSTIVLTDKFMSTSHAEIKAEGGMWILRDVGSTNGTYVNNKRIDRHELVDNDFIKFGSAMLKFKSL
jgi:hypothetical protein